MAGDLSTSLGRAAGLAAAVVLMSGCGTVSITNETTTLAHNPAAVYTLAALVVPSRASVHVVSAQAEVAGIVAPIPMARLPGDRFTADVPLHPCESVLSVRYTAFFEGGRLLDGLSRKTEPSPGAFRIALTGQVPSTCGPFQELFSQRFMVNDPADAVDIQPGDGLCSAGGTVGTQPRCTLRAAVMEANARRGHDIIEIPPGTYLLRLHPVPDPEVEGVPRDDIGDLDITDDVTVRGGGTAPLGLATLPVTIDGGVADRVFDIHRSPGSTVPYVEMDQLAITNGSPRDSAGGGILNRADLRLDRVRVAGNVLRVSSSMGVFSLNRGGGIGNRGRLFLTRSVVESNATDLPDREGGASSGFAGGIWNDTDAYAEVDQSLVHANRARFSGGIHNEAGGRMRIVNSSIGENTALAGPGGIGNAGRLDLQSATVIRNSGGSRANGIDTSGETSLINSIVAENGGADCGGGITSSAGGNAFSTACPLRTALLPATDTHSGSYLIGSLEPNGGYAPSYRLLPLATDSALTALIDMALDGAFCPPVDQRGTPRPQDGDGDSAARCDKGAFEFRP